MEMDNLWVALIIPFVVSLAKQSGFPDNINRLIALAVYASWAALTTLSTYGAAEPLVFLNNFAVTITVGSAMYTLVLKQFGIDDKLTELTTLGRWKGPEEDEVEVG